MLKRLKLTPALWLFFILIALQALANGLSDNVLTNYFDEVYHVDSVQRGFIEFPRELPGLLCVVIITLLASFGDIRITILAQLLAAVGVTVLGLVTPTFGVMLIFLFIYSTGAHLFMPLRDSIGMALSEEGLVGRRMGQYASVQSAMGFVAALIVFFGFRFGWFSFSAERKWIFIVSGLCFLVAFTAAILLQTKVRTPIKAKTRFKLIFRKQYKYYYLLTVLHGVQKQIAFVYGSFVVVTVLMKGADTMALLYIAASFASIFFMSLVGKWIDKLGIRKMMFFDALTFIIIYVIYGFVVWGITSGTLANVGWPVAAVYVLFVLDRLSMQIGMVKSVYLRSISLSDEDVTATLSTGISLDHVISIIAAALAGVVWKVWGSQWVFFIAAIFSLGNLYVAFRVKPEAERARALQYRSEHSGESTME